MHDSLSPHRKYLTQTSNRLLYVHDNNFERPRYFDLLPDDMHVANISLDVWGKFHMNFKYNFHEDTLIGA